MNDPVHAADITREFVSNTLVYSLTGSVSSCVIHAQNTAGSLVSVTPTHALTNSHVISSLT